MEKFLELSGAQLEDTVKIREDVRGIYLVRHPTFGPCVLKTIQTVYTERRATNLAMPSSLGTGTQFRAKLIQDSPTAIFPRVLEIGPFWTLETYIEGQPFRQWMNRSFDLGPVDRFFAELKHWGHTSPIHLPNTLLTDWQIRGICQAYLVKCLHHARYFSLRTNLTSFRRLVSRHASLGDRIRWLDQAAATVAIPAETMCGDMGNVNLLVAKEDDHIYNIDYEFMGPGHWGFDAAYFLSSLAKLPHSPEAIREIRKVFMRTLDDQDQAEFFSVLTDALTEMSAAIYGGNEALPPESRSAEDQQENASESASWVTSDHGISAIHRNA